jgi:hypothetical protein
MMKYVLLGLITLSVIFGMKSWMDAERSAAVEAERRARMADAVELIRESDKALDVMRKASDEDLCRALGGRTIEGVCQ